MKCYLLESRLKPRRCWWLSGLQRIKVSHAWRVGGGYLLQGSNGDVIDDICCWFTFFRLINYTFILTSCNRASHVLDGTNALWLFEYMWLEESLASIICITSRKFVRCIEKLLKIKSKLILIHFTFFDDFILFYFIFFDSSKCCRQDR